MVPLTSHRYQWAALFLLKNGAVPVEDKDKPGMFPGALLHKAIQHGKQTTSTCQETLLDIILHHHRLP